MSIRVLLAFGLTFLLAACGSAPPSPERLPETQTTRYDLSLIHIYMCIRDRFKANQPEVSTIGLKTL